METYERRNLRMTSREASGNTDINRDANILMALLTLGGSPRIGRDRLAERIGVGRGYIRTILSRLNASGMLDTFQTGCTLSRAGREVLERIPIRVLDGVEYTYPDKLVQKAVLLKGASGTVTSGMYQRDMGLKSGGSGCITMVYTKEGLLMPPDTYLCDRDPDLYDEIISSVDLDEGDVIIIGEGEDAPTALRSAVSAAMHSMRMPRLPT